jgi:alpha-glucosidase
VIVARRSGADWYIGAMTDWTTRDVEIDLSFLRARFNMISFADGANADRYGNDYKKTVQAVDQNSKLQIHMTGGGGWAARLVPSSGR